MIFLSLQRISNRIEIYLLHPHSHCGGQVHFSPSEHLHPQLQVLFLSSMFFIKFLIITQIGLFRPFYRNIALYVLNISREVIFSGDVASGSYCILKALGTSNRTEPTPPSFLSSLIIKGACPEQGI